MKKLLLAAVIPAAFVTSTLAQTSVTVYGVVDAGLVLERGGAAGAVNKLSSGVGSVSRLGFRGTEDLGGGLSALFVLESGLRVDTGESDLAGAAFNRQAFIGLKSGSGTLTLGRQYIPYYTTLVNVGDPFAVGYAGSAKNLFPTVGNNTRASNSIMLATPVIFGFNAELAYAFGEQADSNKAGRQVGGAIGYAGGPLTVRLAHNHRNNDVTTASGTTALPATSRDVGNNTLLAGNYNFGIARAYLAYSLDKGINSAVIPNTGIPFGGVRPITSLDSSVALAGVSVPIGASTVLASFIRKNDRTSANQDATQLAVGYLYALSKRTGLYAAYAHMRNDNGAGYTVGNNGEAGSGNRALNLGARHSF